MKILMDGKETDRGMVYIFSSSFSVYGTNSNPIDENKQTI